MKRFKNNLYIQIPLTMSINIEDQTDRLTLKHYQMCSNDSSDDVKKTRGVIYDTDEKVVCSSYAYTPEYVVKVDADKYTPLLQDTLSLCAMYKSEEGSLLRLFFDNNRWNLSTHKRINAFDSKWSSSASFGELFIEALTYYVTKGDGLGKLDLAENIDVFDQFCNTLDREYTYTFLLRTNKDTRIVCDAPEHPTVYFAGKFKDGKCVPTNTTILPSPEQKYFSSLTELEDYVEAVNPLEHQGLIITLPDGVTTLKIVTPLSSSYKLIRGSEPDVKAAYIRLRKTQDEVKLFMSLFPRVSIQKMEEELFLMVKYVHRMYVRRYIKKQFTVVHPALFALMKIAHAWHCVDRANNIVTLERLMDIMEEQPASSVYKMYVEFVNQA
jgi:hypothetical protein